MTTMVIKKITAILLVLMVLVSYAGCSSPVETPVGQAPSGTFTVVDQAGREVEVPENIESIAVIGIAANFVVALGKGDKIVAMGFVTDFAEKIAPNLADVGTVGRGRVDLEALATYNPDLYIQNAADLQGLEAVDELGIPAIGIHPEDIEGIYRTIELLGEVLSVEDKARKQVEYFKEKVEFANSITKNIPEADRKTAIVMGIEIGNVADGGMLQSYLVETAGGINPAKDIEAQELWPMVGMEQIFDWNPDFIFCSNSAFSAYTPEEFMNDPTMAELDAVKNGRVMRVPSDRNSWEHPGIGTALGFLWMMHQMYPELYSEEEFVQEVNHFYQKIYGVTLDREWLGY